MSEGREESEKQTLQAGGSKGEIHHQGFQGSEEILRGGHQERKNLVRQGTTSQCVVSWAIDRLNFLPTEIDILSSNRIVLGLCWILVALGCNSTPNKVADTAQKSPAEIIPASTPIPPKVVGAIESNPLLKQTKIQSGHFKVVQNGDQIGLPGLTATLPKGWKLDEAVQPPRLVNLVTPQGAEVAVFWFGPTAGGTVEENLKRWESMFAPLDSREVVRDSLHDPKIAFGRWQGKFTGDMGHAKVNPSETAVLLAAVVSTKNGSVFFKMVGSIAQTKAANAGLRNLIWNAKNAP